MPEDLPVSLLMFIAARAAENRILEAVQRAGYDDITVAQARIAARIGPNGTRLGELAEQAQVAKQTTTALVDRLERAGYVQRTVRSHRRPCTVGSHRQTRRRDHPHRSGRGSQDRSRMDRTPRPTQDEAATRRAQSAPRDHRPLPGAERPQLASQGRSSHLGPPHRRRVLPHARRPHCFASDTQLPTALHRSGQELPSRLNPRLLDTATQVTPVTARPDPQRNAGLDPGASTSMIAIVPQGIPSRRPLTAGGRDHCTKGPSLAPALPEIPGRAGRRSLQGGQGCGRRSR